MFRNHVVLFDAAYYMYMYMYIMYVRDTSVKYMYMYITALFWRKFKSQLLFGLCVHEALYLNGSQHET